jgi:hypothetical protein
MSELSSLLDSTSLLSCFQAWLLYVNSVHRCFESIPMDVVVSDDMSQMG